MKLATVNPEINLDIEQIFTKEVRSMNFHGAELLFFCSCFIDLFPNFFIESLFKIWEFISPWLLLTDGYLPSAVATRNVDTKLTQFQGPA